MRHDPNAAPAHGCDDAWAVWADEARTRLCTQGFVHAQHVVQRDVLGDGDDEGDFGFDGFYDGGGGGEGGHEDGGRGWL